MSELPFRQVHLDFHTGPHIPDVGADFDAEAFAGALAEAHVNSVTLFAKCHHGHLYYDTRRPERHPGMKPGLDLLGGQIEACRRRGIRTPIYLSVQCDEYAADAHPDWIARNPDGTNVGRKPLDGSPFSWQILDMSSPYADFLEEQIVEVMKRFAPVDGIFLDMCWDQPSVSRWAVDGMRAAGLNPAIEADRTAYARRVVRGYMERYNAVIAQLNGGALPRVWYNSRPKTDLAEEKGYLRHIEIEALPTGGWGYTYFPLNVRWARNFGLPFVGMTARFHKSWSDFGGYKPAAALKYEVCQMLAHGGGCSIGDQLHPRGRLDPEAYRLIGQAYEHVKALEPLCRGARAVADVAVLRDPKAPYGITPGGTMEGVVRLLQQLFVQFDLLSPDADLSGYRLIVVPEGIDCSGAVGAGLLARARGGVPVVLAGPGPLASAPAELRRLAGVDADVEPAMQTVFFRLDPEQIAGAERSDVVCYDGTRYLRPGAGVRTAARIVEPYFQRSWDRFSGHSQSPPLTPTDWVPVTLAAHAAAMGFDIFRAYGTHGQLAVRRLMAWVLGALLPRPIVRAELPSHVELTVLGRPGRRLVHVLSYAPQRRTPALDLVEEATPIVGGRVGVRIDATSGNVWRGPAREAVKSSATDGYLWFAVESTTGHEVFEVVEGA